FTGTIATAFTLFGSAFYYMGTGTFNLVNLSGLRVTPEITVSLFFLIIGFGFKMALFPMHQWAIDTYDGSENSVSAFLSSGSKVLAFVVILKVFLSGFSFDAREVYYLFVILSIVTMTYGNLAALSQNNLKRILAYSSIAQAGYLILVITVVAASGNPFGRVAEFAIASGMFYSLVYIFMKGGSFITLNAVTSDHVDISDVSGLAKKSPSIAVSFSIMLLALAGIPLTGGFLAKYYLFLSLIQGSLWWLAVIAILNSAISVFYYFKIIMYMFGRDVRSGESFDVSGRVKWPVVGSATITVALFGLGILSSFFPALLNISVGLFG
ncbi:MAG: NADH-quinone oxidoreductase subunit N, partial [Thermoplasmataceae archaeon]